MGLIPSAATLRCAAGAMLRNADWAACCCRPGRDTLDGGGSLLGAVLACGEDVPIPCARESERAEDADDDIAERARERVSESANAA